MTIGGVGAENVLLWPKKSLRYHNWQFTMPFIQGLRMRQ